jgi:hypothetical protein
MIPSGTPGIAGVELKPWTTSPQQWILAILRHSGRR